MNNKVVSQNENDFISAVKDITAGSVRGITQIFVGYPLDTVKIRLQTQIHQLCISGATATVLSTAPSLKYKGVYDCFKSTIKEEGVIALWKGSPSPLSASIFYSSWLFFAYGQSKRIIGVNSNNPTAEKMILVGAMTGCLAALVECPIDLVKSKLQVQYATHRGNGEKVFNFERFTSTFECGKEIIKKRGISGLYQGLSATLCRNIPGSSCYFGSYEIVRNYIAEKTNDGKISSFAIMSAGGISGLIFWSTVFPIDVIKSCMQTDNPANRKFTSVIQTARHIYSQFGIKGFWRGFSASILRSIPVNAFSFLAFESSRKFLG